MILETTDHKDAAGPSPIPQPEVAASSAPFTYPESWASASQSPDMPYRGQDTLQLPPSYSSGSAASATSSNSGSAIQLGLTPAEQFTPTSFFRQPPQDVTYTPFKSMFLIANGKRLSKGFPVAPPPSITQPHPFLTHDVRDEDWLSFMREVQQSTALTEKQTKIATHMPIIHIVPIISYLASHALIAIIKASKTKAVVQVVERWNHHFFHPRKMEVVLTRGTHRLSGNKLLPVSVLYNNDASQSPAEEKDSIYRLFIVSH